MKKRILAVFLCLLMVLTLPSASVFAGTQTPEGVWTDYVATGFAGGTGTEDDPYKIATAEQLAKLSNDVSGGTSYQGTFFVLTENIDLSAHRWTPIGIYKWTTDGTTINNSFQGFLDGNDKTISGMFVDETTDHYCGGLFGTINIQKNGSLVGAKDLTITGATVYVDETGLNQCFGAVLAGNVMGRDTQFVVFENITVSGSVHVTRTNGYNNIGGMLGYASWVKATNCHADGVSISGASNCGGFVGNDSGSIYENCTASGTIDGAWTLGGFVGYSVSATWQDPAGASTYTKCAADVDVSGNDWRVGGFVGYAEYGQFNNCVAYGDVTSSVTDWNPKVGGFMGEDNRNVITTACHAVGVVTGASSDYQAGGFIGTYSGSTLKDCFFDNEKNLDLNAAGEGTIGSGVTGEGSAVILANICEDYYGGHQYSLEWTVDVDATCIAEGSKSHHCERCNAKTDITPIEKQAHNYQNGVCTVCGAADPDYVPPAPVYIYYDITASAGEGGTITPEGTGKVLRGTDKTFTITPDTDYVISDVLVDGKSVGAVTSYTFETVREDHSIQAIFELSEEAQEAIRNEKLKEGVRNTTIRLRSTLGNGFIRLDWEKSAGYKVDYYEVYKSTKRYSGFGTEPYFETKQGGLTGWYKNTKELKKGVRYYYKVRGVREIAGETVYTKWSTKAWRLVK